ncbi:MAG TPA: DUF1570 domain-containing protein [Pirellulales bacterium]|jgi:hypothetical protein
MSVVRARRRITFRWVAAALLLAGCPLAPLRGMDHVTAKKEGRERQIAGRVLVEAEDGGLLVQGQDGVLWTVPPDDLVLHEEDDAPFKPLSSASLASRLLEELPAGFEVHTTKHYLIAYNTSKTYAQWCGGLFERLYGAFTNYWSRQGFELRTPEFPLVAIVFSDEVSYGRFAQSEVGEAAKSIIGYYSLATNRMTMYDLTGVQSLRAAGDRRGSLAEINQMLARPDAERMVATVIHEATHQIAFNCGLQTRYADIPLWISEGIAVYFETPDLSSKKGWGSIGSINLVRLTAFREYLQRRPTESLRTLVADDARFRDTTKAPDAYAEAWALNYFLIRQKPKQYRAYLQMLRAKKQLIWDDPDARLSEFTAAFGDPAELEVDFQRYMLKLLH